MARLPNPAYMSYGNTAGQVRGGQPTTTQSSLLLGRVVVLGDGDTVPSDCALVIAESNGGIVNLTLPVTAFLEGQGVYIKRVGANNVVVTASSGQIDNGAMVTLTVDLESLLFIRNGAGFTFASTFYVAAGYLEP